MQAHLSATDAARRVDLIDTTISALFLHKLTLGLLEPKHLQNVFNTATLVASQRQLKVLLNSHLNVLELPASFSRTTSGLTIHIFVPLVKESMTLYKHVETPLYFNDDTTPVSYTHLTLPTICSV